MNGTKNLQCKTTTLHVHNAFLYISLLSLLDHDVKLSNFTFSRGSHQTTIFWCFFKRRYSHSEFNSEKIQHLTNWMTWNKKNEFWNSVNSLFKRSFRYRRRRRITQCGVNITSVNYLFCLWIFCSKEWILISLQNLEWKYSEWCMSAVSWRSASRTRNPRRTNRI